MLRPLWLAIVAGFIERISLYTVEPEPDMNYLGIKVEYEIVGLPFPQQNIEFLLQPTRV